MEEHKINAQTAALLATSCVVGVIEMLRDKGVITQHEGFQLYEKALSHLPNETENLEARNILNILMPGGAF